MPVELRCAEEGHTDKRWLLEVRGQVCVLLDTNGGTVAIFSRAEALRRFKTPSITDGTRHFAIELDEQTVRFDVTPGSVSQIEDFMNRTGPPPAIAAMQMEQSGASTSRHGADRTQSRLAIAVKLAIAAVSTMYATSMAMRLVDSHAAQGRVNFDLPTTIGGAAAGVVVAFLCLHSVLHGPTRREVMAKARRAS